MTVTEMRTELTAVETAITAIMTTGETYAVVGQFSVKYPSLDQLRAYRTELRARILRALGNSPTRTRPDFS